MKNLSQFIIEKFKINSKNIGPKYNYHPKDKKELIKIIDRLAKNFEYHKDEFNKIDVSKVKDLSFIFFEHDQLYNKNFDISEWDVSSCENMNNIFDGCTKFNCNLNNWNVSNVKTLLYAFRDCSEFNMKNIENWNLPNDCKLNDETFEKCKNKPKWYKV